MKCYSDIDRSKNVTVTIFWKICDCYYILKNVIINRDSLDNILIGTLEEKIFLVIYLVYILE